MNTFECVFCQQLCIVIKQNKKLKTNNSGTVFFTNHHISWQWADGNPSTLCFCSKWSEWYFRITLRSQASFFSFFSCFLKRACTSFLVYELILIFRIFLLISVVYIQSSLYNREKQQARFDMMAARKHLIRLRPVSWAFVLLCFWFLSYFRLDLFFVWLYDLVFKEKELNFSLPITKKLWLVFIRF